MAATTCWDFTKCNKAKECSAYPDHGFDCWNVTGTMCRGEEQGSYEEKIGKCREVCKYYQGVMDGSIRIT